jgi:hypothetical protein
MAKRLQVIVQDPEYRDIQRAARLRRMSIAEWVRQALDRKRIALEQKRKRRDLRLAEMRTK